MMDWLVNIFEWAMSLAAHLHWPSVTEVVIILVWGELFYELGFGDAHDKKSRNRLIVSFLLMWAYGLAFGQLWYAVYKSVLLRFGTFSPLWGLVKHKDPCFLGDNWWDNIEKNIPCKLLLLVKIFLTVLFFVT